MKKIIFFLLACFSFGLSFGAHITGGDMFYTLVSQSGNSYTYSITLKLYRDCNSTGAMLDASAPISIFDNATNASVWAQTVPQTQFITENLSSPSPCIQNPPIVCYQVGLYTFTVTLPGIAQGYTVAYQRCCRISGINNLINSSTAGATYTATIPGTGALLSAPANYSAHFTGIDTVIICANNAFCYNFGAFDADGDSLTYNFCNAYVGGSQGSPSPNPPQAPPYNSVPYASPYNASQPLGSGVSINPSTGMVCGIAPAPGIYVVTVCVNEFRNGVLIATQRKDLQIKIGDCNIVQSLPAVFDINGIRIRAEGAGCKSFTYNLENDIPSTNPLIHTYYWEFSDGATYTTATPTHTFADTGVYTIKLVINRGEECSDSLSTKIKVYPGFFTGFTRTGYCVNKTINFFDTTSTTYGFVNSWRWDFGDPTTAADTSHLRNPTYVYSSPGVKDVTFVVTNSVGCIDTVHQQVDILTKPPLSVAFKDTLICNGDTVQLHAIGGGNFTWTPSANVINASTADPTVHPVTTTSYFVKLDDQGCINNDTVKVRVVDFVTLAAMPDTTICIGDNMKLRATTNGLRFLWDNPATLNDPTLLSPTARPVNNPTTYIITSRIGPRCFATDDVVVSLTPYSTVNAGRDTTICFNTTAQLNATTDGMLLSWSPTAGLNNPASLTPVATLKTTTTYVLSTSNALGCISRDTVRIAVDPEVIAFAGSDTAVVIGQPLQFTASGGLTYSWSPAVALNNPNIYNPKAFYDGSFDSIRYTVTVKDSIGCSDDATVLVKVFRTAPKVFVPTAFTPNRDGRNDFVAPIAVGLTKLDYFRIYNRWGQLVFETTVNGKGWDGRLGGQEQASATYVWIVRGTDYTGKVVFDKGTVTLIR